MPLLGETLDGGTLGFSLVIMAIVIIGKRMPIHDRAPKIIFRGEKQ